MTFVQTIKKREGMKMRCTSWKLTEMVNYDPENYYQMTHSPRGTCVILNNWEFDGPWLDPLPERTNLTKVFMDLDFEVDSWTNLTKKEIEEKITELKKSLHGSDGDAFVMVVSSHGDQGVIFDTEGKEVRIQEDIIDKFKGDRCKPLLGKPKIFFVDACQGAKDPVRVRRAKGAAAHKVDISSEWFHPDSDMLIAYATTKGYVSYTVDDQCAGLFLLKLGDVLDDAAHIKDLASIMTIVKRRVAEDDERIQLPVVEDTLVKTLYFLPGQPE